MAFILAGDGSEVDLFANYSPPPETHLARLENALRGIDTFQSLVALHAKEPGNVAAAYKLAEKYRYKGDSTTALAMYGDVIALDPQGEKGSVEMDGVSYPCTELAALRSARIRAFSGAVKDPAPVKAFIRDYPGSGLVEFAYNSLDNYYSSNGSKEEALAFYREFTARYPGKPNALSSSIARILKDKDNIDWGLELAEKLKTMNPDPFYLEDYAKLHLLKNDSAKAEEVYGKDYIEDRVGHYADALVGYAAFWTERKTNLESAERMADTAVRLCPESWYILRESAGVFLAQGKEDKALGIFGPAFVRANQDNSYNLRQYARFWAGKGQNLESALEAAKRMISLTPTALNYDTLSLIHIKLKNYPEALKAAENAVELAGERAAFYKSKIEPIKKLMAGKN